VPARTQDESKALMEALVIRARWPAQAMLKHVHAEHSRETHVRATAMAMERQCAPRYSLKQVGRKPALDLSAR
jgi:hypothetical protein